MTVVRAAADQRSYGPQRVAGIQCGGIAMTAGYLFNTGAAPNLNTLNNILDRGTQFYEEILSEIGSAPKFLETHELFRTPFCDNGNYWIPSCRKAYTAASSTGELDRGMRFVSTSPMAHILMLNSCKFRYIRKKDNRYFLVDSHEVSKVHAADKNFGAALICFETLPSLVEYLSGKSFGRFELVAFEWKFHGFVRPPKKSKVLINYTAVSPEDPSTPVVQYPKVRIRYINYIFKFKFFLYFGTQRKTYIVLIKNYPFTQKIFDNLYC